jgi:hypothetical protein
VRRLAGRARAACCAAALDAQAAAADAGRARSSRRLTGQSSRIESELRVLTDEIGGRPTGSAAYERALQWGLEAFRRAGVDSGEARGRTPRRRAGRGISATARRRAVAFPLRVVSFGSRPRRRAVRARSRRAVRELAGDRGARREGARRDPPRRTREMKSFDDLFAEYQNGPEMMAAADGGTRPRVLVVSTRPARPPLSPHDHLGRVAPIPMAQVAREDGERLGASAPRARCPTVELDVRKPRRRAVAGAERHRGDPRLREARTRSSCSARTSTRGTFGTGAQDNGGQLRARRRRRAARSPPAAAAAHRPLRAVHQRGDGLLGPRLRARATADEIARHVAADRPRHRRRLGEGLLHERAHRI